MKFFFAGDVLLKEESYTGSLLSPELQKLVGEHDIVCCNLEGPYIKKGTKEAKKRGPSISQGKHVLQRLKGKRDLLIHLKILKRIFIIAGQRKMKSLSISY